MRILLVKLSSMGDIFHTYPAISDLKSVYPGARLEWLVDRQFAEIAAWHPGVDEIHPLPLRALKKNRNLVLKKSISDLLGRVRMRHYDFIIDAQGLIKSAWLTRQMKGLRCGYNHRSIREKLATLFYQKRFSVSKEQHAITRIRQLFAKTLNYEDSLESLPEQGLKQSDWQKPAAAPEHYGLIFPGTTWLTKHWPLKHWRTFLQTSKHQIPLFIGWGTESEQKNAMEMSDQGQLATVFDFRLDFEEMASWIAHSDWVIGVDTGFVHLANAMQIPVIAIFGPTSPQHTGVTGDKSRNIAMRLPCFPCRRKTCKIAMNKDQVVCMEKLTPDQLISCSSELFIK